MTSLGSAQSWQSQPCPSPCGGGRRIPLPVLGQQPPTTPRELRRALSLPPHVKVPKSPRPERSLMVGGAVVRGLREGVSVTVQDLLALRRLRHASHRAMSQGRMYEAEKQMKGVERYQKRLEFHLSQVEDLLDQYSLHQRLREGVRNMAYAYAVSPGKERTTALNNVRSGYRECTETLCALEVQIEHLIGTLALEMKGIQGFARLCPGDVFEVTVKHGRQKWRSRGRVGRDGAQTWDNSRAVFKALIGEVLHLKAVEVRLLGKSVVVGARECETRELFSPHPQLMTVNLNHAGSLKLSVIVTWNPLEGSGSGAIFEDCGPTMMRTASISSSSPSTLPGGRLLHTPTLGAHQPSLVASPTPHTFTRLLSRQDISNSIPECVDNDSSFGSMSARSSSPDSSNSPLPPPDAPDNTNGADESAERQDCLSCCSSASCAVTSNFTLVRKKETRTEQWARYSQFSISNNSNLDVLSRSFPHLPTVHNEADATAIRSDAAPSKGQPLGTNGNLSASLATLPKESHNSLQSLLNALNTTSTQSLLACAVSGCASVSADTDGNQNALPEQTSPGQSRSPGDHPLAPLSSSHSISSLSSNSEGPNQNTRQHLDTKSKSSSRAESFRKSSPIDVLSNGGVCSSSGLSLGSGPQQPIICQPSTSSPSSSSELLPLSASSLEQLQRQRLSGSHRSSCPSVNLQNGSEDIAFTSSPSEGGVPCSGTETDRMVSPASLTPAICDATTLSSSWSPAVDDDSKQKSSTISEIAPGHFTTGQFGMSKSHAGVQLGSEVESESWRSPPDIWDPKNVPSTLPKLVTRVQSCLEDIQGQWPPLQSLHEAVQQLQRLCKTPSRRASVCSNASLNIDEALECFDFLDAESDEERDCPSARGAERAEGEGEQEASHQVESASTRHLGDSEGEHDMESGASTSSKEPLPVVAEGDDTSSPTHESKQINNKYTSSLDSKYSIKSNLNSLDSKGSGKSSPSNTLEDKSTHSSSEGSKSSDSSTLEDKSRSSGQSSLFSNTLEDKSSKSAELSSGTSTLELDHDVTKEPAFVYVPEILPGSRELHKFLCTHLRNVLRLLQNLGLFGPLQQLERWSITQLESEGQLLTTVLQHSEQLDGLRPHHLLSIPHVQVLWDSVSPSCECWCVSGEAVVKGLLPVVTSLVPPQHTTQLPRAVLQALVVRVSGGGRGSYSGREVVTAGHFLQHLRPPLQTTVPQLATALLLEDKLRSQAVDRVSSALAELREPTGAHVRRLGELLQSAPPHLVHHVTEYLAGLHANDAALAQMLDACLMELESKNSEDRAAACVLLATITALRPQQPSSGRRSSSSQASSERNSGCLDSLVMDTKLDVPLFINEETLLSDHSSSSSSALDHHEEIRAQDSVVPEKVTRRKRGESESILSHLLSRRKSNASSTSSTKSTKSCKSNIDSGISSSPKRGSLVSSLESSSSGDAKRPAGAVSRSDVMSSSYPSAWSGAPSLAQCLQSTRPHSSYTCHPSEPLPPVTPPPVPLTQLVEVLSFVQHNDNSGKVQRAAKQGLQQLGPEGAAALQQWTLSAHGFQGVEVRPKNSHSRD